MVAWAWVLVGAGTRSRETLFEGHVLIGVFLHDLGLGQLEVLLGDVDPALPECVHAGRPWCRRP